MNKKLLQMYGLAFNPFSTEVPLEALRCTPPIESFCWKIEHTLLREGGFALVTGEVGEGKSSAMRILEERLMRHPEVRVGVLSRPQGGVSDFYRELGERFDVPMRPHNRWCGFKALRETWQHHIDSTLHRPVLLVDEAQEMQPAVLSEMRLLASTCFDSRQILSIVLAGDSRLLSKLQRDELLSLASRIRTRLTLEYVEPEELRESLKHSLAAAGNPSLMTPELIATLADHAAGNYRLLATMGGELLASAAQRDLPQLDEKLYLDVFTPPKGKAIPAAARRKRA